MRRTQATPVRLAALGIVLTMASVFGAHPFTAYAAPGDITTVAGTGKFGGGDDGDGGPVLQANISVTFGIATTSSGKYYVSQTRSFNDTGRVRAVQSGTITSVAGGVFPPSPDGVPATQTFLQQGGGTVADADGNLYIATQAGVTQAGTGPGTVRKVDATTGIISTLITGPFTSNVAIDGAGTLYLENQGINSSFGTVTKFDPATGAVTTVAGGGSPSDGLGDGGQATAAQIDTSTGGGLAVDAAGDIYIGDVFHKRVRRVDAATGIITTVAGNGTAGFSGDGGPATSAEISFVQGVALDAGGNLYIGDVNNDRVRKVDTSGTISTFAGRGPQSQFQCLDTGDGGPATAATVCGGAAVTTDPAGNVYFADGGVAIRRVDPSGTITTVDGNFQTPGFFGDGGPATKALLSGGPSSAPNGNLLIDDASNNRIREIDHNGIITTVAGGGIGDGLPALQTMLNTPEGVAVDPAGNLVIADCGDNRVRKVDASGVITSIAGTAASHGVGDGGPATSAGLECPAGLAFDSAANLYIADSTDNRVRRVDPSGVITTVAGTGAAGFSGDGGPASAAQLNGPSGVLIDGAGNIFIADRLNNRVRKIDTSGTITTVAGNGTEGGSIDGHPATDGPVVWPVGLQIAPDGSLIIAESGFASIRRVDAKGIISTIAGNGIPGYSGDGGPASFATLDAPMGIAYDSSGNLLIADSQNDAIRNVAAGTPPPVIATKKTADCGMTVTQNLTLSDDIGPCPGDGLMIGADGVHLNLNGHTITGSYSHTGQSVGIRVTSHSRVKISDGTVTGFDAGVALISGYNNIVTGMTVANNQGSQNTGNDTFGDGIVMFASSRNTITGNSVLNNGPFDGISMIGQGADNNLIQDNTVKDTIGTGRVFQAGTGLGITTNPFLGFDRPRMVSLNGNQIVGNTVINNAAAGISTVSNVNGVVRSNISEGNGFGSFIHGVFPGNGIGVTHVQQSTFTTSELVENNQVYGNARSGIEVVALGNQILNNVGNGNGVSPLRGFDFRDGDVTALGSTTLSCVNNTWSGNQWGTGGFIPDCASNGGSQLPGTTAQPQPMTPPVPEGLGDPPPRQSP
jgi:sugar lactone lactonase YvrE